MSEETSLISMHPFFQGFVFSVIETIRSREGLSTERAVVDADLIPKVSDRVNEVAISREVSVVEVPSRPVARLPVRKDTEALVAPINVNSRGQRSEVRGQEKKFAPVKVSENVRVPEPVVKVPEKTFVAPEPVPVVVPASLPVQEVQPPVAQEEPVKSEVVVDVGGSYGAIEPLLSDPSVSTIECLGDGKELMVVRAGQKQKTRIVLSTEEIKGVLEKVADETHIPLMEGIFRASVKDFSVNAVVSDMVGSRFVIKKNVAYNLLE